MGRNDSLSRRTLIYAPFVVKSFLVSFVRFVVNSASLFRLERLERFEPAIRGYLTLRLHYAGIQQREDNFLQRSIDGIEPVDRWSAI